MNDDIQCRSCGGALSRTVVNLGSHPSANRLIPPDRAGETEPRFPLRVFVCEHCLLVQIPHNHAADDIFNDGYLYFSSYSQDWVAHAERYVETVTEHFGLGASSLMIEIASNDGYLLQHAVKRGIPCIGIDPARGCAEAAADKGVETIVDFFSTETAERVAAERGRADLICGNNVFAHVPPLNDFVAGITRLLKPDGVLTLEFPHLQRLIEDCQFDTIYDEHYSYFSLTAAKGVLERHGLRVFDVERLPTHGGSLRIYACHSTFDGHGEQPGVAEVLGAERDAGLHDMSAYDGFQPRVDRVIAGFAQFLAEENAAGRRVCGFGAAAKGNTFLNTFGAGPDTLMFVCDHTPAKQGRLLPGSRIPVVSPDRLAAEKPDTVVILPWNVAAEIIRRNADVFDWGGKFATFIPERREYRTLDDLA
ncbi:MAG: class I SAM-dependent methyltransferase [Rhodospirillales bacterium]